MLPSIITLFGEAERGAHNTPYFCRTLEELFHALGQPPLESEGLFYAVQAILYGHPLYYLRVHEEGGSLQDYHIGFELLLQNNTSTGGALFLPRMGFAPILDEGMHLCKKCGSLLLITSTDFYDYMTCPS